MIEDFLNQLKCIAVFSIIDLRARYHQLRMVEEDCYKIAFTTHKVYYEFLLIPFGLTSALSSFYILMNLIFMPLHTISVMMCFDNMLINRTWHDHVIHLGSVFELMKQY